MADRTAACCAPVDRGARNCRAQRGAELAGAWGQEVRSVAPHGERRRRLGHRDIAGLGIGRQLWRGRHLGGVAASACAGNAQLGQRLRLGRVSPQLAGVGRGGCGGCWQCKTDSAVRFTTGRGGDGGRGEVKRCIAKGFAGRIAGNGLGAQRRAHDVGAAHITAADRAGGGRAGVAGGRGRHAVGAGVGHAGGKAKRASRGLRGSAAQTDGGGGAIRQAGDGATDAVLDRCAAESDATDRAAHRAAHRRWGARVVRSRGGNAVGAALLHAEAECAAIGHRLRRAALVADAGALPPHQAGDGARDGEHGKRHLNGKHLAGAAQQVGVAAARSRHVASA